MSGRALPSAAAAVVGEWLAVHDGVAPGLVEGLAVVGSIAFDDWQPRSDIDLVAFTADPATEEDADLLANAHARFVDAHDGPSVDVVYLAWGDIAAPPMSVLRPWTLAGEFHHDGECFEINPITWYTLAEVGIAVRGGLAPEPQAMPSLDDRRTFVRENVDTYWRSVRDDLARAAGSPDRHEFPAAAVEWSALGIARMLLTYETGDVASKTAAGRWAAERVPSHAALLERAVAIRSDPDPAPVDAAMLVSTVVLLDDAIAAIAMP